MNLCMMEKMFGKTSCAPRGSTWGCEGCPGRCINHFYILNNI